MSPESPQQFVDQLLELTENLNVDILNPWGFKND